MRTAIYVYKKTTLWIQTSEDLKLARMSDSAPPKPISASAIDVDPGVYKVQSQGNISVFGSGIYIETFGSDKDPFPTPPPGVASDLAGSIPVEDFKLRVRDFLHDPLAAAKNEQATTVGGGARSLP